MLMIYWIILAHTAISLMTVRHLLMELFGILYEQALDLSYFGTVSACFVLKIWQKEGKEVCGNVHSLQSLVQLFEALVCPQLIFGIGLCL